MQEPWESKERLGILPSHDMTPRQIFEGTSGWPTRPRQTDQSKSNLKFFVRVAFSGDFGGSYYLTKIVGTAKARELYYLGSVIKADEALKLGIINKKYLMGHAKIPITIVVLIPNFLIDT